MVVQGALAYLVDHGGGCMVNGAAWISTRIRGQLKNRALPAHGAVSAVRHSSMERGSNACRCTGLRQGNAHSENGVAVIFRTCIQQQRLGDIPYPANRRTVARLPSGGTRTVPQPQPTLTSGRQGHREDQRLASADKAVWLKQQSKALTYSLSER